jgi:hypothetical protein
MLGFNNGLERILFCGHRSLLSLLHGLYGHPAYGLRFDAALELLMQALNRVGRPGRLSLRRGQTEKGKQALASYYGCRFGRAGLLRRYCRPARPLPRYDPSRLHRRARAVQITPEIRTQFYEAREEIGAA